MSGIVGPCNALDVLGGEVGRQMERFRRFWSRYLDALGAELARTRRERRHPPAGTPSEERRPGPNDEEEEDE
ncbi:hypothetical protein [Nonomuraea sp. MG754425]|uniref:hypothetical protein n=1 Tax=Nonomuraea sp. MG754425 TaxID=2570319 RepID=UPI001F1E3719|nr:hypothetical protein [Nonomuraea sp. MG754425]